MCSPSVLNLANDIAKNVGYRGDSIKAAKVMNDLFWEFVTRYKKMFLAQLVLNVLETKYAQTSDPELRRCVEKVIGELHRASAAVPAAAVAAPVASSDSPASPVAEQIPIAETRAVRHVTSAEYQTRLLEYKVRLSHASLTCFLADQFNG